MHKGSGAIFQLNCMSIQEVWNLLDQQGAPIFQLQRLCRLQPIWMHIFTQDTLLARETNINVT